MKYIKLKNNTIDNIMLNEACSSGCGSFIEGFSKSLNISIDEFAAHTLYGKYALIINDLIKKKTLDILPNRKKDYLMGYLIKVENRGNVKYVIGDMYEPYLLVTKAMFKNAKYVVDRFHYVKYIMDAIDRIRKRLQKEYGYNSREYRM